MARRTAEKNANHISIQEALRRRTRDIKYEELPTDYDADLRVEEGKRPEGRSLAAFITKASVFYRRKNTIDRLTAEQKKRGGYLIGVAQQHDGLRGVVSRMRGFRMAVYPKTTIEWNREKLQAALGAAYSTVVAEDLKATVSIPLGRDTEFGPMSADIAARAMKIGFMAVGFAAEEVPQIVSSTTEVRVDEHTLLDMVQKGQTDVEAAGVAEENWAISTTPINP
jgi:hypothetical protein